MKLPAHRPGIGVDNPSAGAAAVEISRGVSYPPGSFAHPDPETPWPIS